MSGKWFLGMQPEYDGEYQYADHFVGGATGHDIYTGEILSVEEVEVQDHPPDGPVRKEADAVVVARVDHEQDARRIVECVNFCEGVGPLTLGELPPLASLVNMWEQKQKPPVGGAAICGMSDMPLPRAYVLKVINERLGWHRDNLAGWREGDGYLVPSEPDLEERRLIRAHLRVAMDVLEELKKALGLE
jgi:hypothetical protein